MLNKAKQMLHDDAAAEDAVQDTFLYFADHLEKIYRIPCNRLPLYVVMCVKRKCIDRLRARKTEIRHVAASIDNDAYAFEPADPGASVEEQALLKMDVETVQQAFSLLPESLKDILRYKYLLEMSDHEIAALYGIKETSVRVNLSRARRAVYRICEDKGYV